MLTNRFIIIGISLLAIIGGGVYFSLSGENNGQGNALVESGNASSTSAVSAASIKNCPFETSEEPEHSPVIINEIAWMGTKDSANYEWIELENISTSTTSMGGWELVNQNEKIKVVFKSGAKIGAQGFYLLERGSSDFLTGIKADTFFTGSLKNSGDSFRLFDKNCSLIDEIIGSSSWPAGDNAARKTMERDSKTLAWHTSVIVGGTPKEENLFVIPASQSEAMAQVIQQTIEHNRLGAHASGPGIQGQTSDSISNTLDSVGMIEHNQAKPRNLLIRLLGGNDNVSQTSNIQPLTSYSPKKSNVSHILISQVQITGGAGKTDNDFIEIYNSTGEQFNLKGYRLVKRAQNGTSDTLIKSWATNAFIPAYGFYLWANSSFTDISVTPDSTTSETLSNDNGIAIRYGPNDTGAIIDSVAWGKAQNVFATRGAAFPSNSFPLNPSTGQSLLRKGWQNNACLSAEFDTTIGNGCDTGNNAVDFELMQVSGPRDSGVR